MNSSLKKYLLTLLVCSIVTNVLLVIKGVNINFTVILGVNLFYFIPVTLLYIIFILVKVAFGKSPS